MRFGGFTEKSRCRAAMRMLKDQLVFEPNGQLRPIKSELVLSFSGAERYRLTSDTWISTYYHAISKEKTIRSWKMLLGVVTSRFELNPKELETLISGSETYLDPNIGYRRARWHDVVVLLLIIQLLPKDHHMYAWAAKHLNGLERVNGEITQRYQDILRREL